MRIKRGAYLSAKRRAWSRSAADKNSSISAFVGVVLVLVVVTLAVDSKSPASSRSALECVASLLKSRQQKENEAKLKAKRERNREKDENSKHRPSSSGTVDAVAVRRLQNLAVLKKKERINEEIGESNEFEFDRIFSHPDSLAPQPPRR